MSEKQSEKMKKYGDKPREVVYEYKEWNWKDDWDDTVTGALAVIVAVIALGSITAKLAGWI